MSRIVTFPEDLTPATAKAYRALVRETTQRGGGQLTIADDQLPHVHEMADAGLASISTWRDRTSATIVSLAPGFIQHTVPDPDERASYIELWVPTRGTGFDYGASLLAALWGSHLSKRDRGRMPWDTWSVDTTHATATDFEHSSVYLTRIGVEQVTLLDVGMITRLIGRLGEVRAWPANVDPFAEEVGDYTPTDKLCTHCETPHPYGPYMAPSRDDHRALANQPVLINIVPTAKVTDTGHVIVGDSSFTLDGRI